MSCTRRAVARGTALAALAVLSACSEDGTGTGAPPDASPLTVTVSPKIDSLGIGTVRRLTARVTDRAGVPRSATVAWMSLNNAIATVNATGDVTAVGAGFTGIVATIGSSADTATIVVRAGQLTVEPNAIATAVGEEIKLSVTTQSGAAASGAELRWTSSDTTVARIATDGTVTAVGAGDATILATLGNQQGSASLAVRPRDIASLRLTPGTSSIYPAKSEQLELTAYDDAGRVMDVLLGNAKWSTSNAAILGVDDNGIVTGKTRGSGVVSARIGSKAATASVNVLSEPAASVTVTLAASTLEVGQTAQATATLLNASGLPFTGPTVAWQSSNPAIATVNATGLVTAVARGTATISAIADGKTGSAPLTVAAKTAAAIVISPNAVTTTVGQSAQLTATVKDASGGTLTGRTITWATANTAVATVSSSGLVNAVGAGSTTISATADGVTGQASFTTTSVTASSVSITPTSPVVQVGQDTQLTATAYDAGGTTLAARVATWSSANPTVATVSSTGRVTGVSSGHVDITATIDGKAASVTVGVNTPPPAPVASVTVSLASTLNVGQTAQATVVLRDASGNVLSGRTVTWSSPEPSLATVSSSGLVTAVASGSATIVATSEGVTGAATVIIATAAPQPVATVTLSAPSTSMIVGQSQTVAATLRDAQGNVLTGRTIGWSSSNLAVVTVTPTGQVQAVGAGSATVTATSEGKSGSIALTVTTASVATVASVTVTGTSALNVGQTSQLTATPKDSHGTPLTGKTVSWSSSAAGIASVSSTGLVTAVAAGTAVINATVDGVVGSLPITVGGTTSGTAASVTVAVNPALNVGQTAQATATATDANGTTVTATFAWSSSNSSVATVTSTGMVSAVGAGSATITATTSGKSGNAVLTVSSTTTGGVSINPPELPRAYVPTTYPAVTGTTRNVPAGGDLQAALDAAQPGDQIVLAPGASYVGNFTLPARSCSGYVIIRSGTVDSDYPATGTRISPAYAPKLAKIVTPNVATALTARNGSCKWWISRVEITGTAQSSNVNYNYGLVRLGEDETSIAAQPSDIVLDRVYLHGTPSTSVQHGVIFNAVRLALIDSYVSDIHWPGVETHAVSGWAGAGPFKIVNNYLEAASINVLFGGSEPTITNLSPSDIEVRNNYFYKPLAWKGVGYVIKNLLELKHAKRVVIENNVLENSWADGQIGWAMIWQSLGDSPWTQTADVTFRNNIVRNANGCLTIAARTYVLANPPAARFLVENNLFENIGGDQLAECIRLLYDLSDIRVSHNTILRNTETMGEPFYVESNSTGLASRIELNNNVAGSAQPLTAIFSSGGYLGKDAMSQFAGSSWSFSNNVIWRLDTSLLKYYPGTNYWPATQADVGFAADWSLGAGSAFKGKATDGTDPGANMAQLRSATSGVKQ